MSRRSEHISRHPVVRSWIIAGPYLIAAVAGAAVGLLAALLLLRFGDPHSAGTTTRSNSIFAVAALPARWWHGYAFGWVWPGSRASEFLAILPLNGAVWSLALTALARRLRRSARARRITFGSVVLGTALAALVWVVGIPIWDLPGGLKGVVFRAQQPGMILLSINGYTSHLYDGSVAGEQFRPGPLTLIAFAGANTLLLGAMACAAGWAWRQSGRWRRRRDRGGGANAPAGGV